MYCQTSSSVQLDSGNTRMLSPLRLRALYRRHSSGRWFFGIPPVLGGAEREDALLRPDLLLVAAGAAERRVEAVLVERLLQRLGLHHVGVHLRSVVERIDALGAPLGVDVDHQLEARSRRPIRSRNAYISRNFHGRVDVQQRKRQPAG